MGKKIIIGLVMVIILLAGLQAVFADEQNNNSDEHTDDNQIISPVSASAQFNLTINNPINNSEIYFNYTILNLTTSVPTTCTYARSEMWCFMRPSYDYDPEISPSYNARGCGGGGGPSFPLDRSNATEHTQDLSGFRDRTREGYEGNYTIDINCTDEIGNSVIDSTTFRANFSDPEPPEIISYSPKNGGYLFNVEEEVFSINYSDPYLDHITLYIEKAGDPSSLRTIPIQDCEKGQNQQCNVTINLSRYTGGDRIQFYFEAWDIYGKVSTTKGYTRHIEIDANASTSYEFYGTEKQFEVIGPYSYASSGDTITSNLYTSMEKSPIVHNNTAYHWHETMGIDNTRIKAIRDEKDSALRDQYDEIFLELQGNTISYNLTFETPISEDALLHKNMWFQGRKYYVMNATGFADRYGMLKLFDKTELFTLNKMQTMKKSKTVMYNTHNISVTLNNVYENDGEYYANITVNNTFWSETETKQIASGNTERIAYTYIYVSNASIINNTETAEMSMLFILEDGGYITEDGIETTWQVWFDYSGDAISNIRLADTEPHTTVSSTNSVLYAGDYLRVAKTDVTFVYNGLGDYKGNTLDYLDFELTPTSIDIGNGLEPAIKIETPNNNTSMLYFIDQSHERTGELYITTRNNSNEFYYESSPGNFEKTSSPIIRLANNNYRQDNYIQITYKRLTNETGYLYLWEPYLKQTGRGYRTTIEFNSSITSQFGDINGDSDKAFMYYGNYGTESSSNFIANSTSKRDYYTKWGTYVSNSTPQKVTLSIPRTQLYGEFALNNLPVTKIVELIASKKDIRIEEVNKTIVFAKNDSVIVELPLSSSLESLSNISLTIETEDNSESIGELLIHGLGLPEDETKSVYISKNIVSSDSVCVKDVEATELSFTNRCDSEEEVLVICNSTTVSGPYGNYTCIEIDGRYKITGLHHSSIKEYLPPAPVPKRKQSGGGGGGGWTSTPKKKEEEKKETIEPLPDLPEETSEPEEGIIGGEGPDQGNIVDKIGPTGFAILNFSKKTVVIGVLTLCCLIGLVVMGRAHSYRLTSVEAKQYDPYFDPQSEYEMEETKIKKAETKLRNLKGKEKEVLKFIIDEGGKCNQATIRNVLSIPNTSLCRTINSLERRGIIETNKDRKVKRIKIAA